MANPMLERQASRIEVSLPQITKYFYAKELSELTNHGVTMPQYYTLLALSRSSRCTMSELGQKLSLTYSTMTGIVDRLVRDELATREHDTKDRRKVYVSPTLMGREIVKNVLQNEKEFLVSALHSLNKKDQETVVRAMEIFVSSLTSSSPQKARPRAKDRQSIQQSSKMSK